MTIKDITFHYTNEQMVNDLIKITPIKETESVLDAGSGKNKVWYKNLKNKDKFECELEDGIDYCLELIENTKPEEKRFILRFDTPFHLLKNYEAIKMKM